MAKAGSPMGKWYESCLNDEDILGDLATKGTNAFIFGGFRAYIDLCNDEERIRSLDALFTNPRYSAHPHLVTKLLDRHITPPAYEALEQFYAQHFGNPEEFKDAYMHFTREISLIEIRSMLTQVCYDQRRFEL